MESCPALVCILCVLAICSRCEAGLIQETVCFANRTSLGDGLTHDCSPLDLPQFSCASYSFESNTNQSRLQYSCERDSNDSPLASIRGSQINNTLVTSLEYSCVGGGVWCLRSDVNDCLTTQMVPQPPSCNPVPRCRSITQLAINVSGTSDTNKYCSQLTEERVNGVFANSNDSIVIMQMRNIRLLSSVVNLGFRERNCSTQIRNLLCAWIFPECTNEILPQAPCGDYCLCVINESCSTAYANVLEFLNETDDAFGGEAALNPLNFLRGVSPEDCSNQTLSFYGLWNYSESCVEGVCEGEVGVAITTKLPTLSDEALVAAIVVPIVGVLLLVLVLLLLCCCCCMWMNRKKDLNYPFAPSYNSRVGTLFGLPFSNQTGSAIRSRCDLVKAVPDEYKALLSEHKDILLQSSKIHTSVFLADGSYSEVYQGYIVESLHQAQTYRNVAIKRFKEHLSMAQILSYLEVCILLNEVDHSNVVHLTGIGFDPSGSVLLVYPYFPDHDLLSFLKKKNAALSLDDPTKKLNVVDLMHIVIQIAQGMAAITQQGSTYRMLSAHTCMVGNDLQICVGDVCMVQLLAFHGDTKIPIFHRWMAPEAIMSSTFSEKSDVWSFGITCWEVFSLGANPHGAIEDDELVNPHITAGNTLARPPLCPEAVFSIFLPCWQTEPANRPHFSELVNDLKAVKDSAQFNQQVDEINVALKAHKLRNFGSQDQLVAIASHPKLSPNISSNVHHRSVSPLPSIHSQGNDDNGYVDTFCPKPSNKRYKAATMQLPTQIQRRNTDTFQESFAEDNKYETVGRRRLSLPAGYSSSSDSEYENADLGPANKRKRTSKKSNSIDKQVYYNLPRSYLDMLDVTGSRVTQKSKSSGDLKSLSSRPLPRPPVAKKPVNVKLKTSSDSTRKFINSGSPPSLV